MTLREFDMGTPDYVQALTLREAVLRAPLGLAITPEELAAEPHFLHLGGLENDRVIAVLLLRRLDGRTVKMRQVAVHPEFQKRGLGSQLIAFAEERARALGFKQIVAHARESAAEFYRKLGYAAVGETFLEATIPHRFVTKDLSQGV